MKNICVVTGSRSEYGLLRWVMEGISQSTKLKLQIIVTGMHLSSKFGYTADVIESDGFQIDCKVNMSLSSDTSVGITKSMAVGLNGFGDALAKLKPDILLILGDRYEIFVAAIAAMIARIPIVHLHGGELTEGAFDDSIRHSITKMSHLHFAAAEEYRNRIIQLGEQPDKVFNVGGVGIDNILRLKLLSRDELEAMLNFKFLKKNLLITFHPVTLETKQTATQTEELLNALLKLKDTGLIFTMPNADIENELIFEKIRDFCSKNKNAKYYTSLGQLNYLSCIKCVDGVVGNSSSGLIEAPAFKKGTVNIGDRQRGRLKALSIIDCKPTCASILTALDRLFSKEFQELLKVAKNPYGVGGSSQAIVKILEQQSTANLLKKSFYNVHNL
jgi:GDP/UDP-N,N'-diacetylbacillosamine 2-epimerase (hydrolysing)